MSCIVQCILLSRINMPNMQLDGMYVEFAEIPYSAGAPSPHTANASPQPSRHSTFIQTTLRRLPTDPSYLDLKVLPVAVLLSCTATSGFARLRIFKNSATRCRILECMYAFEHLMW